jgi:hypothetical protein
MFVYLVVDVPDHHDCAKTPKLCDPIAIFSTERRAWDVCKEIGTHSVGYCGPIELDYEYAQGENVKTIYPNCPNHHGPEPKPAESVESAGVGQTKEPNDALGLT